MDDFHAPVGMFDQCGTALDPVAVVVIEDAIDGFLLGMVDMAADHASVTAA